MKDFLELVRQSHGFALVKFGNILFYISSSKKTPSNRKYEDKFKTIFILMSVVCMVNEYKFELFFQKKEEINTEKWKYSQKLLFSSIVCKICLLTVSAMIKTKISN